MKEYEDAAWRQAHALALDWSCMLAEVVGHTGIPQADLKALSPRLEAVWRDVEGARGQMAWRDLPYVDSVELDDILACADQVRQAAESFVVFGIGGSALGPLAVHQALRHLRYNELDAASRGGPRLYVEDNVDPERMAALLDVIDPEKTVFNVVSKSGATAETMSQFLIITRILKQRLGSRWQEHIIITTDPEKGVLRQISKQEGIRAFPIPAGVGGRFSQLCAVGLLPAAVTGVDIRELLAGAAFMDARCRSGHEGDPALLDAALQYLCMQKGINISVLIPYADSLKFISDWWAQLWAESLGKRFALDGHEVFSGQTPVKALGVTDQHSQIQLYTEGPFDKVITFLTVQAFRSSVEIPGEFSAYPELSYLSGFKLEELLSAEQRATRFALSKAGRPNKTIILPAVNAFTLGQLLYFFEVETAYAAALLGIDAFDQPGVEEGKKATYALFGRQGYEQKKQELEASPFNKPFHMI